MIQLKKAPAIFVIGALVCLSGWGVAMAQTNSSGNAIVREKSVGPVKLEIELAPREPVIGDEVKLTIRAIAEEGVELLMPEFGEALSKYSILEFVPKSEEEAGQIIETQIYTLQPIASGPQSIPPILVEFVDNRAGKQATPDDFDAYEVLSERIDFEVQSVLDDGQETLAPPMPKLEIVDEPVNASSYLWLGGLVGLLSLAGGAAVFWLRRSKEQTLSPFEIASNRLATLKQDRELPTPRLSTEDFFVEISATIREYVEARFSIKAPELTTDEFLARAAENNQLTAPHQSLLREFLEQADIVKFAGVEAGVQEVNRSIELATQFLSETRPGADAGSNSGQRSSQQLGSHETNGNPEQASGPGVAAGSASGVPSGDQQWDTRPGGHDV